ncbi:MAG: ribonucleotide-diphosphate reductase subunit beta [Actinobacteria bacterium]|nr:ribonucleotide-diphosphate reductase subunit beta [Actinomycetota bacterium]
MNDPSTVENTELNALGDVPIDDVVALMDRPAPDYRELYYRWERQQWEAGSIDFMQDRNDWLAFPDDLKRSFLWGLSSFYVGEEQVTHTLVPFVDAVPTEEQQVFLSTQLVDEARHTVFFDRFYSEALDEQGNDMNSRLERQSGRLNSGFRSLLLEMLPAAAEKIRVDKTLDALVEGIVLYHIVIEGTLALTGQRFLLNYLRESDVLPGFRQGFTAVARDESRHVNFGVRFLGEAVSNEPRFADLIRRRLEELTPVGLSVIDPPDGDASYFDPLPYGPEQLTEYALSSLDKRLRAMGVDLAA